MLMVGSACAYGGCSSIACDGLRYTDSVDLLNSHGT